MLKGTPRSWKTVATPSVQYCKTVTHAGVLHKLQSKIVPQAMLQSCPERSIAEGVFGRCYKAYFQGTVVCVKVLKDHTQSSKSALLHEAEILSIMCHPSLCWLVAMQVEAVPFQLVLPYYAIQGRSVTYHDLLFKRDKPQFSFLQHYSLSCQLWIQLLHDVTDGTGKPPR